MPFIINTKAGRMQSTSDNFVVASDLQEKDMTLTIAKVENGMVKGVSGRECKRILVYFKGAKKPLVLNMTNGRTIRNLYGRKVADWIGKPVTLYSDTCNFGKDTVDCIRIRDIAPPSAAPAHQQQPQSAASGVTLPGEAQEPPDDLSFDGKIPPDEPGSADNG